MSKPLISTLSLAGEKMPALPVSRNLTLILYGGVAAGFGLLAVMLAQSPERGWSNILLNNYYFLSLGLAGMVWVAINYVTSAGWGVVFRRIPESLTALIPTAGLAMLLLYFGMHTLYEWTHESVVATNVLLQWKQGYLNIPFFFIRMFFALLVWIGFSRAITRNSLEQDQSGALGLMRKNVRLSAIFLVLFGVTFVLTSFDWIMSLEPEWYSSMFPVYTFAGMFINGIATITLIVILMRRAGLLPMVNENHLHDLGKMLFAFSIFWGYIWFSQYMLIWYANIAEETTYFLARMRGGWHYLFYLNAALNWLIPFLALMTRSAKRREKLLFRVCLVVMAGHWLDLYMMIMPVFEETPHFGLCEIFSFIGYFSLFALILLRRLSRVQLVPLKDPYLKESLELRT